ncbi:MAG: putative DNA-binding domain-containing protein [Alphaproteobacteria bacterium]
MQPTAKLQQDFCRKILSQEPLDLRQEVYRNNTLSSLYNCLKDTFRRVNALVGDDFFRQIAHAFIRHSPPKDGRLHTYGDTFPEFLQQLEDLPYLQDIARLDWAYNTAFTAADSSPLSASELKHIPPELIPDLTFAFPSSLSMIHSPYALQDIWGLACGKSNETIDLSAGPCFAMVIRPHMEINLHWLDEASFCFFDKLRSNKPLQQAVEEATQVNNDFDLQSTLAFGIQFNIWTSCAIS